MHPYRYGIAKTHPYRCTPLLPLGAQKGPNFPTFWVHTLGVKLGEVAPLGELKKTSMKEKGKLEIKLNRPYHSIDVFHYFTNNCFHRI